MRPERRRTYHQENKETENARNRWRNQYATDYAELLKRGKQCVCCGNIPVTFDHIFSVRKGKTNARQARWMICEYEKGNLQFLCFLCNNSKFDKTTCRLHEKYLGLWNYLPVFYDMEA
jgi:5-methylcytosine-specific restriction endonuclease McrA